jgi:acyl-CoA hydrolase
MGRLHGGDMLSLLAEAGMLSARKVTRGVTLLASLDDVEFKKPVKLGDLVEIRAETLHKGNTSVEVSMRAIVMGEEVVSASGSYVKVDDLLRPTKITEKLEVSSSHDEMVKEALERRAKRLEGLNRNMRFDVHDPTLGLRHRVTTSLHVSPEMTYDGRIISAGRLMKLMDDMGGTLGLKLIGYTRYHDDSSPDTVVTVAVRNLSFYSPVRLNDIITIRAGITYVGNTSMETVINVIREDPSFNVIENVSTAYFSYVRVGRDGKPKRMPEYIPSSSEEKLAYSEALSRRGMQRTRT